MNSTQIYSAIEEIAAEPSKNEKEKLVKQYMEKDLFRDVLRQALDPFITFGIRPKRHEGQNYFGLFDTGTFEMLNKLASRALTGAAAALAVSTELERLDAGSSELLWRVINKDLKAGFSESTVNKAHKSFFKSFPYQRCSLPKDTDLTKWPWGQGVLSQLKADGMYVNANVEQDSVLLATRQGNPLPLKGFEALIAELSVSLKDDTQSHGELLVFNAKQGRIEPREIGNGQLNRVIQGGEFDEGCYPILELWDQIPLSAVVPKGSYTAPYVGRLRGLNAQLRAVDAKLVRVIETRVVKSLKEAYQHYAEKLKEGKEGTVIKHPEAIWRDGTSKEQIKLKLEAEVELRIVGFEEGKEGAKTAKTFGSLQLASFDGKLRVNCSGFTDALRQEIHDNRETWINGIVTVRSNGIMFSVNPDEPHSLFLPRFVERRYDKDVADTFERIKEQFEAAIDLIVAQAAA